jgi:hypothetical protein
MEFCEDWYILGSVSVSFGMRSSTWGEVAKNYQHGLANVNPVWANGWSLRIPAKMKIFAWRFLRGAIPCKAILANRHIITSSVCPVCLVHCEDTQHLFFKCTRAFEIWENLGIANVILEACNEDRAGSGAFEAMLRQVDKETPHIPELGMKEIVTIACWFIWWERRKIAHDEKVQKPASSAQAIAAIALNYWRALKKNVRDRCLGWEKPKEDYVKLNVDAAFSPDSCSGAMGQ